MLPTPLALQLLTLDTDASWRVRTNYPNTFLLPAYNQTAFPGIWQGEISGVPVLRYLAQKADVAKSHRKKLVNFALFFKGCLNMNTMKHAQYDLIVFDLGGVLIELTGVPQMLAWAGGAMSVEELWRRWLHSPAVRDYESGNITTAEFGKRIVVEFNMPISPEQYLTAFTYWPRGYFPGAEDVLRQLAQRYPLAVLSNTNELHYTRFVEEMRILDYVSQCFFSYQIGLLKPDPEIFAYLIAQVGVAPERILFFDDNQLNVDGAAQAGIQAYRVYGVEETTRILQTLEII